MSADLYSVVFGRARAPRRSRRRRGSCRDAFGRFRDAFVVSERRSGRGDVAVYTRLGGYGNRRDFAALIARLRALPSYVVDEDDGFDSTYATFWFGAPNLPVALRIRAIPKWDPDARWAAMHKKLDARDPELMQRLEVLRPTVERAAAGAMRDGAAILGDADWPAARR